MDTLPPELLHRIITLALPIEKFGTFRERYDLLLSCCLVNHLWAAIARRELGHAFRVANPAQLERLTTTLDEDEEQVDGRECSLRLARAEWETEDVEGSLAVMNRKKMKVKEMWIYAYGEYYGDSGLQLHASAFQFCRQTLTSLHLGYTTILPLLAGPSWALPNLTHLSLADPPADPIRLRYFFEQLAMPLLQSLALLRWPTLGYRTGQPFPPTPALDAVLARLGPGLKRLALWSNTRHLRSLDQFWTSLDDLEDLTLHLKDLSALLEGAEPSPARMKKLKVLRFHADDTSVTIRDQAYLGLFLQGLPRRTAAEGRLRLELPMPEIEATRHSITTCCEEQGVELEWKGEEVVFGQGSYSRRWEALAGTS